MATSTNRRNEANGAISGLATMAPSPGNETFRFAARWDMRWAFLSSHRLRCDVDRHARADGNEITTS
jgi:hypothetical protein